MPGDAKKSTAKRPHPLLALRRELERQGRYRCPCGCGGLARWCPRSGWKGESRGPR